jgi:menaquinone-specific isochorismate synthase
MKKNDIVRNIVDEFQEMAEHLNREVDESIIRVQVEWEKTDILDWLAIQDDLRKIYWSDRDKCCEMGGIGVVHRICGDNIDDFSHLFKRLESFLSNSDHHLRYYGGIRFNYQVRPDELWQKFNTFDFVIPKFELLRTADNYFFAANILIKKGEKISSKVVELKKQLKLLPVKSQPLKINFPKLVKRSDMPDWNQWRRGIDQAYKMFKDGELDKIVLARKTTLTFDNKLDTIQVIKQLKKTNPNAFHFCFQQNEGISFIGATPERLYKRDQRKVYTEAVAGTRARGKTAEHDAFLKEELLSCEKDLREHQYVVDKIRSVLLKTCRNVITDEKVNIIENTYVQHLCYKMQGELKEGITDAQLLRNIHPTPAVGGYPADIALQKIDEMENFDRGWYAGPVGWVNHSAAEFAVALRSGLIDNDSLSLFAGAGIVDGSKAADEWDEIDNKIGNFIQILRSRNDAE